MGSKLCAYHEVSRQQRATINLAKAVKVIDDRPTLSAPEVPGPGKSRRKSAFAEMEDGYMFVEEGFRIRFANGETIDFYADSPEDKRGWMQVLSETIGNDQEIKPWCELVLKRERKERERIAAATQARTPQQQTPQPFERQSMPSPQPRPLSVQPQTQARPIPPAKSNRRPQSQLIAPAHAQR